MEEAVAALESLRRRICLESAESQELSQTHLSIAVSPTGCHVDFYGEPFGEFCEETMSALGAPAVAPFVASIRLRGPDEGANGTKNWDLEPLFIAGATFERLSRFEIEPGRPGDHNRTIVASVYEEGGVLAKLLAGAPDLRELTVPSAPSPEFFEVGERPLRSLSVDAGYDAQGFLGRLSESTAFPELISLEWGEFCETYLDDFEQRLTPAEEYRRLFASPLAAQLRQIVFRNPRLSDAELGELKRLAPHLQVLVVRMATNYV